MSYISQLAIARGGGRGSWAIAPHIITLPGSGRGAGGGVPPLGFVRDLMRDAIFLTHLLSPDPVQSCLWGEEGGGREYSCFWRHQPRQNLYSTNEEQSHVANTF
jgi:hypothetical protein